MKRLLCIALLVAACGDEETNPPPPPGATPAGGAQKKDDKAKLTPRRHVEDNVVCPLPADGQHTGPECKPDSPTCKDNTHCLQFNDKWYCEPCAERDGIRRDIRESDFVNPARDPFQSYVIIPPGMGEGSGEMPTAVPLKHCTRKDQFPAKAYSFADMKLVGIVSRGTMRKALMMDSANRGWIIKRGDCVGKEQAVVKEIGTGSITFVVDADPSAKRGAEMRTVQLHPETATSEDEDEPVPSREQGPTPETPKLETPGKSEKPPRR